MFCIVFVRSVRTANTPTNTTLSTTLHEQPSYNKKVNEAFPLCYTFLGKFAIFCSLFNGLLFENLSGVGWIIHSSDALI